MTDEEYAEAKHTLESAIKTFFQTVEPDAYIDDWILVVHKDSIELTAEGTSVVSTLVPTGQPFHRTTGLLTIAQSSALRFEADDDE